MVNGVVNGDRFDWGGRVRGYISSASKSLLITYTRLYGIISDCWKAIWIVFSLNFFLQINAKASKYFSLLKFLQPVQVASLIACKC